MSARDDFTHLPKLVHLYGGQLLDEIDRLRTKLNDQQMQWFYLLAHPEHAKEVAREVLFGTETERDSFGHVIERAEVSTTEGHVASGRDLTAMSTPSPAEHASSFQKMPDPYREAERIRRERALPNFAASPSASAATAAANATSEARKGVDAALTEPSSTPSTDTTPTEADHV